MSVNASTKHSLWETPIWEIDLNFPIKEMLSDIIEYAVTSDKKNLWDLPSRAILDFKKELSKIVLEEISNSFPEHVVDVGIGMSWINLQHPGESVPVHNHNGANLLAIFYLQAEENSGNLILVDARGGIDWGWEKNGNYIGVKSKSFTPKIGKLLLVPAYVLHCVEENKSNTDRISFVSDLKIRLKEK